MCGGNIYGTDFETNNYLIIQTLNKRSQPFRSILVINELYFVLLTHNFIKTNLSAIVIYANQEIKSSILLLESS